MNLKIAATRTAGAGPFARSGTPGPGFDEVGADIENAGDGDGVTTEERERPRAAHSDRHALADANLRGVQHQHGGPIDLRPDIKRHARGRRIGINHAGELNEFVGEEASVGHERRYERPDGSHALVGPRARNQRVPTTGLGAALVTNRTVTVGFAPAVHALTVALGIGGAGELAWQGGAAQQQHPESENQSQSP